MNTATKKTAAAAATASENTRIATLDDAGDTLDQEVQAAIVPVTGNSHDDELSGDRVDVTIFEQEGDAGREDVFIGINGVGYQIKRGSRVSLPVEVVHVLDNSVQTIYESQPNGDTRTRQLKRFNYTVHGKSA